MIRTILVPLDGSAFAEQALGAAGPLARRAGARVVLATVHADEAILPYAGAAPIDAAWAEREREHAGDYVRETAARVADRFGIETIARPLEGPVVETLVHEIRRGGAELVVMTTHGRGGLGRAWLGSVADGLLRQIRRPLLLIRPTRDDADDGLPSAPARTPFQRILVPLDGSERAERILPHALEFARLDDAVLILIRAVPPLIPTDHATAVQGTVVDETDHAYREEAARKEIDRTAERLREQGVAVRTRVARHAQADAAILDAARACDADLIAMATRGRAGATRFLLGSIADKVLREATVPLLLVRPPQHD